MIPYGRQNITDDDIAAVVDVLKSDFITQGPAIERFEQAFATYCGVKYAVAVSSCTAALHLACLTLGVTEGSKGWTSPNTFVASANALRYCGGDVDFVDIDPKNYNMSLERLEEKLESGAIPDVLIPVHFSGEPCDMKPIAALAKKYGFSVIEDAAHCVGASYEEEKVGSCQYSDMTVFSFHPVKIITSGEGGMITTNSEEYYQKLLRLRTHGVTRDPGGMVKKEEGAWYFEQLELGYHYRMTDIHAALGLSQLSRLDQYVQTRRNIAARYQEKLKDLPLQLPPGSDRSSWHLYVVRLDPEHNRRDVYDALRAAKIGVNVHYIPVHTHPYYQSLGFNNGDFPESERYYESALTLPLYPGLMEEEQDYICDTLKEVLQ